MAVYDLYLSRTILLLTQFVWRRNEDVDCK